VKDEVEIFIPWNPLQYQRRNEISKLDTETGWLSDYSLLIGSFVVALLISIFVAALIGMSLGPFLIGCLVGFWVCFCYARLREHKLSKRSLYDLSWGEDIRILLSADGVSYGNETFTLTTHWPGIDQISDYDDGLFLHQLDRMASIPIPDVKLPERHTRETLRQQSRLGIPTDLG